MFLHYRSEDSSYPPNSDQQQDDYHQPHVNYPPANYYYDTKGYHPNNMDTQSYDNGVSSMAHTGPSVVSGTVRADSEEDRTPPLPPDNGEEDNKMECRLPGH